MQWMIPPEPVEQPYLAVFRTCFSVPENSVLEFRYSADERANLFLDGVRVAGGPERGTPLHWHYAEETIPVRAGEHILTVQLLAFGEKESAKAQVSLAPGFYFREHSRLLSGQWECRVVRGCKFRKLKWIDSFPEPLVGPGYDWEILSGRGDGWKPVNTREDSRVLCPPQLPPMRFEEITSYTHKGDCFLFDDYVCAYAEFVFSGTGTVRLCWSESGDSDLLTDEFNAKHIDYYFAGDGAEFQLPGQRVRWMDYWWHAGRTLKMTLTGDAALESVRFYRTGYPYRLKVSLEVPGDERMSRLLKRSFRTIESCSFETFMDCPFYEQLQYIGDTRVDALAIYAVTADTRLIEKAMRQIADGQYPNGAIPGKYPSNEMIYDARPGETGTPQIPSFILFYIQMVHDFFRLRNNSTLPEELLPVLRKAESYIRSRRNPQGLLTVPGWNFIDWRPNWNAGVPPGGEEGGGCTLNWIYLLSLKNLAEMESRYGNPAAAAELTGVAEELLRTIVEVYYDAGRGMFAETPAHDYYSEHAQVFALLAAERTEVLPALKRGGIDECGIYFSFYYLEACRRYGLTAQFEARKEKFLNTADAPQLRTMPEQFPNDAWLRSDCHAWSSHFLYHYFCK